MLDMVRWMLDLGWPKRISSSGGILVSKGSKANITDTQTATFDYDGLKIVWQHRSWGEAPDPKYPWGATLYGDKGAESQRHSHDFTPLGQGAAIHKDVAYELEQYPEDRPRKIWRNTAPRDSRPHEGYVGCDLACPARGGYRAGTSLPRAAFCQPLDERAAARDEKTGRVAAMSQPPALATAILSTPTRQRVTDRTAKLLLLAMSPYLFGRISPLRSRDMVCGKHPDRTDRAFPHCPTHAGSLPPRPIY
jgi:hypothetical protein